MASSFPTSSIIGTGSNEGKAGATESRAGFTGLGLVATTFFLGAIGFFAIGLLSFFAFGLTTFFTARFEASFFFACGLVSFLAGRLLAAFFFGRAVLFRATVFGVFFFFARAGVFLRADAFRVLDPVPLVEAFLRFAGDLRLGAVFFFAMIGCLPKATTVMPVRA